MLFPFVVCTFLGVKGKDLCRYEVLIYEMVMVHERASLRSLLGQKKTPREYNVLTSKMCGKKYHTSDFTLSMQVTLLYYAF